MSRSRTSRIRELIHDFMADEAPHDFNELLSFVISSDSSLLSTSNMLTSILSRMVKTDPRYTRPQKGVYQFISSCGRDDTVEALAQFITIEDVSSIVEEEQSDIRLEDDLDSLITPCHMTLGQAVSTLKGLSDDISKSLDSFNFEMSQAEIIELQTLYQLKKQLHAWIREHS